MESKRGGWEAETTGEVVTESIGFGQGICNQEDAYKSPNWLNAFPFPHTGQQWGWLGSQCVVKLCCKMIIIMEHGRKERDIRRVEWSSICGMKEYLSLGQPIQPERGNGYTFFLYRELLSITWIRVFLPASHSDVKTPKHRSWAFSGWALLADYIQPEFPPVCFTSSSKR